MKRSTMSPRQASTTPPALSMQAQPAAACVASPEADHPDACPPRPDKPGETAIDPRELRNTLGSFVTGVTVITTLDQEGNPQGVTANSFSSVSLNPPLVLWSQSLNAKSFSAFRDSEHFVVNILGHHQVEISQRFARTGEDKFAGIKTVPGVTGSPVLDDCAAFLECRKIATYPGGDHAVYVGEVLRFARTETRPLAFSGGKYMLAYVHDIGSVENTKGESELRQVHALQLANAALPDICGRIGASIGLAVWGNRGPTVIRWELSAHPIFKDLHTGLVVSPILSACGQVFSAYCSNDKKVSADIEAAFVRLEHAGVSERPTREEFHRTLADIRKNGASQVAPPRFGPDIAACAAPVFDRHGHMIMALTVVDCKERLGTDLDGAIQQQLREEARELSRRLGY
ncbi:flavin reductase [Bordetella sp. BOR01]|uniref:flavin reductase n=1 Tax=Bordetella sp. BOR01 TaxID=2854779 RepID=UPI001C452572|nr:flavin reductase [Bordetella sp. BOR01]MBV7486454.1 flavin reductase [Bordetella sp. BOR01]